VLGVRILAEGGLKARWLVAARDEYLKRLTAFCVPKIIEVEEHRLGKRPSAAEIENGLKREGKAILAQMAKLPRQALACALCIEGEGLGSVELAARIQKQSLLHPHIAFIVGGSHGLSPEVTQGCGMALSLSRMTFPHQLARIMLLEQIYRAFAINSGMEYHK
jgi:23S rRNA (pseudouridine1915-N3)-methyltransferase